MTDSDDDAGSIRRHEDLNTPGWRHYNPPKTGKRYPMGKLQPLQNELKSLLAAALSEPYSKLHIGGKINVEYVFIPPGIISYTGDHRDLFLLKIHDLVEDRDEMAKIRHCEMCGKFFFRVRRQKFCSRTCTLQTNKKTWMDKQREKKEAKLKKQKGK